MLLRSALVLALLAPGIGAATAVAEAPAYDPRFMYNLAETSSAAPSDWTALHYDREHDEVFAVVRDTVRIFNRIGMETFAFPVAREFGGAIAIATASNGDVFTIASGLRNSLVRYSFRGEPLGKVAISGAPAGTLDGFSPDVLTAGGGQLFLADRMALRIVATDEAGRYQRSVDVGTLLGLKGRKRAENGMGGFGVDADGNLLFTVPTLFQAFILAPDGSVRSFGVRGSSRGKFNIVGSIAADDDGRILVLDVLRAAVIVFDRELNFVAEFGGRGWDRGGLIAPLDLVAGAGKAFVAQSAHRGVSVFRYSEWRPRSVSDVAVVSSAVQSEPVVNPGPQRSQAAH